MNKLRIKKLGILSIAKMYAVIMFVMGLIFSIPFGLIYMFAGVTMMGLGGRNGMAAGGGGIVVGLILMIAIPVFYGAMGFVIGAIIALLYNLFAGMVGGVEIEVENLY